MPLTVQFLGRRLTDASSTADWAVNRVDGGGGQSWTNILLNTTEAIQGGSCISADTTANSNGKVVFFNYDYLNAAGGSLNFAAGGNSFNSPVWVWAKMIAPQSTGSSTTLPGLSIGLSSAGVGTPSDTNTAWWTFYGSENYPGGWVRMVVNPSTALPTVSGASFSLSSVSHVGMVGTTTTSKGSVEVAYIDAIDLGSGIMIFGNQNTFVYGQDGFREVYASGESSTAKWGVFEALDDNNTIFKIRGQVLIGDASGTNTTNFTGTNSILVYDSPRYVNSTNSDFERSFVDINFQKISIEGNTTNPTNIQFGLQAGVGDDTRGRNGVIFIGNNSAGDNKYNFDFNFNDTQNVTSLNFYGSTIRGFFPTTFFSSDTTFIWYATGLHGFYGSFIDNSKSIVFDSGVEVRNSTFLNHSSIGATQPALYWSGLSPSTDINDIKNCSFINNDVAIEHIVSGSFIYDNLQFANNDQDIRNLTFGTVIINAVNGTPINLDTGNNDIIITTSVTLTITGFVDNSELYGRDATDATNPISTRFNEESVAGNYSYIYNDPGSQIDLFIMKNKTSPTDTGYQWLSIRDFALPSTAQTLQVFQIRERNT